MYHNQIAYIKINDTGQILDHNVKASLLLYITKQNLNEAIITDVIPMSISFLNTLLSQAKEEKYTRALIFKNLPDKNALILLYFVIEEVDGGYSIKFINWLNWINNIYNSLESNYITISNLDYAYFRSKIKLLTETNWFRTLLPLLMHIPKNFVSLINSRAFFDIMKVFSNKRNNEYSKDYNRDTLSRIKNWVKKDTGISSIDIKMLIDNDFLINIIDDDQLIVRNNLLTEDLVIFPEKDQLLECLIRNYIF